MDVGMYECKTLINYKTGEPVTTYVGAFSWRRFLCHLFYYNSPLDGAAVYQLLYYSNNYHQCLHT